MFMFGCFSENQILSAENTFTLTADRGEHKTGTKKSMFKKLSSCRQAVKHVDFKGYALLHEKCGKQSQKAEFSNPKDSIL